MKAIKVTELKANLSKYLRIASRGGLVKDRDTPIAQLGPPEGGATAWHERLAAEGRLRLGSQDWARLRISTPAGRIDIQASLRAVRDDPDEAPGLLPQRLADFARQRRRGVGLFDEHGPWFEYAVPHHRVI
jgi:antitoxin (DNA-binding transcriptional repressor) of toxin-antitoxin stability system